jgi:hypothetical protein
MAAMKKLSRAEKRIRAARRQKRDCEIKKALAMLAAALKPLNDFAINVLRANQYRNN